jgi:acetyl-CoA acyltransferase
MDMLVNPAKCAGQAVNGGAIALGHPLGCTGAKLSVQLFNEMRRRKQKYGVVTMCVGTGQGAASVFELLN